MEHIFANLPSLMKINQNVSFAKKKKNYKKQKERCAAQIKRCSVANGNKQQN